jgi:hypothetical protein
MHLTQDNHHSISYKDGYQMADILLTQLINSILVMSTYLNTSTISQSEYIVADNQAIAKTKAKTKNLEKLGKSIYYEAEKAKSRTSFYIKLSVILIIINALLIINAFAQTVTVNNVTITNSSVITVKGALLSNAGSSLDNDGTIEISGDLTNNSGSSLFGLSTGSVLLNGGSQNIAGSSSTGFNDLTIAGTGAKILQQDISVGGNYASPSGVLSLSTQHLILNSQLLTVKNPAPTAVNRTTGFIVSETDPVTGYGEVKWVIGTGTGNYIFPFGNALASSYLPVSFNITAAGNNSSGHLTVATYPTSVISTPNNRPLPTGLSSLMTLSGSENAANVLDRWWVMDATSYSTPPVSDLALTYRDNEWDATGGSTNSIVENLLKAQSSDGNTWTPVPAGIINATTNTVIINNVNAYNPFWTLAGSNGPLPIELLVFDASLNDKNIVDLNWATATEINNDFFTVEKSRDGINFEPFTMVDGAGNSTSVLYYQTEDTEPFEGITYYRLKQTDYDGAYSYSDIRAVNIHKINFGTFAVFPNPANDHFYIKFDDTSSVGDMQILDVNGKVIRNYPSSTFENNADHITRFERDGIAPGIYFVTAGSGQMQKLIFQ